MEDQTESEGPVINWVMVGLYTLAVLVVLALLGWAVREDPLRLNRFTKVDKINAAQQVQAETAKPLPKPTVINTVAGLYESDLRDKITHRNFDAIIYSTASDSINLTNLPCSDLVDSGNKLFSWWMSESKFFYGCWEYKAPDQVILGPGPKGQHISMPSAYFTKTVTMRNNIVVSLQN